MRRFLADKATEKLSQLFLLFNFQLFTQLQRQATSNVFISPFSIAMGLAILYNGAEGATREAIATTLGISNVSPQQLNQHLHDFLSKLRDLKHTQLSFANTLIAKKSVKFNDDFIKIMYENYQLTDAKCHLVITNANFDSQTTVTAINQWVSEHTQGKINKIVNFPIDTLSVLLMFNIIYFKSNWATPFPVSMTRPKKFTLPSGETKQVPMMTHGDGHFYPYYYEDSDFQAIQLTYDTGSQINIKMVIFLPAPGKSLTDFSYFEAWQRYVTQRQLVYDPPSFLFGVAPEGRLVLPRFTVKYETQLSQTLELLGMGIAFQEQLADFSNMAHFTTPQFLQHVGHKAIIEVNEISTEAVAVTDMMLDECCEPSPHPFTMIVNRPFWFVIEEGVNNLLFMGLVTNPELS